MSASRLVCKRHGKARESYLQQKQGDFSDGTGALLIKGKLSTGPWYCDECEVRKVLKKGASAYFVTFYRADEMTEIARFVETAKFMDYPLSEFLDMRYLQQYFMLNGRETITAYGPAWSKGIPCRVIYEAEEFGY